MFLRVTS
jgi:hypothetical protein